MYHHTHFLLFIIVPVQGNKLCIDHKWSFLHETVHGVVATEGVGNDRFVHYKLLCPVVSARRIEKKEERKIVIVSLKHNIQAT
jgi:hypothetical protein